MEHPDYGREALIEPSEDVQIWCNRLYLERAKEALIEMGGKYTPSQAESKAQHFQDNIDQITTVKFEIGGFCSGYTLYTITFDEEHLHYDAEHSIFPKPTNLPDTTDYPMPKYEFLDELRELYIGEWRHNYNTERFGYMVCDGTQWSLEIEYSNGAKTVKYYGDNAYPYNFNKFLDLLGLENEMDIDGDEE